MPMTPTTQPTEREASRWLSRYYKKAGASAALALGLPLVGGVILVVQAYLLAWVLHQAIVEHAAPQSLLPAILAIGGLLVVRAGLGAIAEIVSARLSERLKLSLRETLFANMLGRGPVWTRGQSSGALSTAIVEQVEALDGFFARYMPAAVQASLLPIAFMVVVFPIDWVVGLLFAITAPLIPVFMALAGWGAQSASRSQARALSRLTGRFADRLRGLVTLKLFGREEAETAGIFAASEEHRVRSMGVMRIAFLSSAVLEFFAALGVAGVALYVGLTFLDLVSLRGSELTLSAGLFCLLMAPEVYQPLRLLAAHYHDRASAKAAVQEIAGLVGELPDAGVPQKAPGRAGMAMAPGPLALEAQDLTVAAPDGRPVIVGASLAIAPGRHVALLGASGGGKSTLLEAIAGLRDFEGILMLGGVGIGDIDEAELRARVAVLGQRPRLFAGTIADNIRLGFTQAHASMVELAAERARVTDFADTLPQRLDTPLGENGIGLSGGEIQRIALARIYLRNPDLILLDEPTAHLDRGTETLVLDGLMEFAQGRTLLVVTHSAAVAARADQVLRLTCGRILPTIAPARSNISKARGAA